MISGGRSNVTAKTMTTLAKMRTITAASKGTVKAVGCTSGLE